MLRVDWTDCIIMIDCGTKKPQWSHKIVTDIESHLIHCHICWCMKTDPYKKSFKSALDVIHIFITGKGIVTFILGLQQLLWESDNKRHGDHAGWVFSKHWWEFFCQPSSKMATVMSDAIHLYVPHKLDMF